MTGDSHPIDPLLWQKLAESELASATNSRTVLMEAHQDAFKWLLASLLAINGGGLLATINASSAPALLRSLSGSLFYIGIMGSLLSSYLSQSASRALLGPLGEAMGYWMAVAHDGEPITELWEQIDSRIQAAVKKSRSTEIAGWISAIAFSFGVLVLGVASVERPSVAVAKMSQRL